MGHRIIVSLFMFWDKGDSPKVSYYFVENVKNKKEENKNCRICKIKNIGYGLV